MLTNQLPALNKEGASRYLVRFLTPGLVVFLISLLAFSGSLNGVWAADHPTSFLELDYAIWAHHSFVLGQIGQFSPQTVDDLVYNGDYYSALAPGTPILALPFVGLGLFLDGHYTQFGYTMLLSEFFIALTNAIAAYLVYKIASTFFGKRTSVFIGFAYAFSTISWPFATMFFQSDVSAMFVLLAAYSALRVVPRMDLSSRNLGLAGLAVAVGLTVDYVNAILIPIIFVYLLWFMPRKRLNFPRLSAGFLLPSALGVLLVGLYNVTLFGSPLISTEQVYLGTTTAFAGFSYPVLGGLGLDLFSPARGLFLYCPLLVIGAVGLYYMLRQSAHRTEGLLFLLCFLGILLPYSMWYDPIGGSGFGPRFLVPAIPFLLLPAGFVLERGPGRWRSLTYPLYFAGVIINGVAAVTSAIPTQPGYFEFQFLEPIISSFLSGGLDAWWISMAGQSWWSVTALLVAAAAISPFLTARLMIRKGGGTGSRHYRGTSSLGNLVAHEIPPES